MNVGFRISRIPAVALPIGLAVLLLVAPWFGLGIYWNQEIVLTVALALMVSGLNLSLGYAGELALGQVFVYAVGAYVSGNIALHISSDLFLSLLVAIAAALVIGVASGIPGLDARLALIFDRAERDVVCSRALGFGTGFEPSDSGDVQPRALGARRLRGLTTPSLAPGGNRAAANADRKSLITSLTHPEWLARRPPCRGGA